MPRAAERLAWSDLAFQAGFMLIALALAVFRLADKGLWVDEAVSLRFALQPATTWFHDNNMALFYALLSVVVDIFGDSERALRGLSVVCFAACVPVFYALLWRACNARAARIASALFVSNAYLLHFAQEARGYLLAVLLVISASYAWLRLSQEGGARWALSYGLLIGLALYAHAFALWLLPAHVLCALLVARHERQRVRPFALAFALAFAFALPLVLRAVAAGTAQISWLRPPTWDSCLALFVLFAGGSPWLLLLYGALFLGFMVLLARGSRTDPRAWTAQVLIAAWFVVPVLTTLVVSRFVTPLVHPKYLLIALPALLAGVSVCLAQLRSRLLLTLALLGILLFAASGLCDWYTGYEKEQWREAVAYLRKQLTATDALLLDLSAPEAFDYYALHGQGAAAQGRLPPLLLPDRPYRILWGDERAHGESENLARIAQVERLWLVRNRSHDQGLRAQILHSHRAASLLRLEPHDGDERSLFASSEGRVIYIESFERAR
jgi:mannosyltransferase